MIFTSLHSSQPADAPSLESLQSERDVWFIEAIGGEHVARTLTQFHIDKMSFRKIARIHEVDDKTIKSWIIKAHTIMRRNNKLPQAWEHRMAECLKSKQGEPNGDKS